MSHPVLACCCGEPPGECGWIFFTRCHCANAVEPPALPERLKIAGRCNWQSPTTCEGCAPVGSEINAFPFGTGTVTGALVCGHDGDFGGGNDPRCALECYSADFPYTLLPDDPSVPCVNIWGGGSICSDLPGCILGAPVAGSGFSTWYQSPDGCSDSCCVLVGQQPGCNVPPNPCPDTCDNCPLLLRLNIETEVIVTAFCAGGSRSFVFPPQQIALTRQPGQCFWQGQNHFVVEWCFTNNSALATAFLFCEPHPEQGLRWLIALQYNAALAGGGAIECRYRLAQAPGFPTCPAGFFNDLQTFAHACFPNPLEPVSVT